MINRAVGVVIKNPKGQIALFQRGLKARHEIGKWENCGGAVEEGETPLEAVKREVREEIGLTLEDLKELEVIVDKDEKENVWEVYLFEATINTNPTIIDESIVKSWGWFDQDKIAKLDLTSYCRNDFKRWGWI